MAVECKERGGMFVNFHCMAQCTNKVEEKTSSVTAGLRSTLRRFLPSP